jgi:phytanoyl-CoA hydroxylase
MHAASISQIDQGAALRRQYGEDGYCLLPDFIPRAVIDEMYDGMMALFARQLRRLAIEEADWRAPDGLRQNLVALFEADRDAYLGAARQSQLLPAIHRFVASEEVVALLRTLGLAEPVISTKPVCHYMTNALKIPGGYHKAPPHQDWRSMQGSLDGVVLWLPLVDIDEDSYPVECVPGSHKLGLLDTVPHPATPMVSDARIRDEDYIPLLPKRGDLVVFSGFLVHRTGERGDDRVRVALSLRYNNAAEPSYAAHRFPTPYTYGYQLDLLYENFPAENAVRELYAALER